MTRILLVRHGHVEGINPERFRGRADIALIEQGLRDARAVAQRISEEWSPVAVYTSPLNRCVVTGAFIAEKCGCPSESLPGLIDIDYGALQWKTHEDAKTEYPLLTANWFAAPQLVRFPNGESLQDVAARAADVLRLMCERHAGETIVLVGHDSINRVLLLQALDLPLSAYWTLAQSPCGISEVSITDGTVRVERINETGHLRGG